MPRPASKYDELYAKYPFLSEVAVFQCDEGWFGLLSALCEKLANLQLGPDFKISQVKEKLRGLRFYPLDSTISEEKKDDVYALIGDAVEKSFLICERCGQSGHGVSLNRGYLIKTLCEKCEKEADK
ncbi:MAG: hypothetical protein Q7S83_00090 [bacterium]|nr:hypothetical protein [bacterium]